MQEFYKKWNNLLGWIVFAIATVVYVSTIEPSASLWDCGEYIATAYKIEIGHPPGAPLFLLIANFFSNFAGGDVTQVAYYVNMMSALSSSFTILFLFWTITHFARRIAEIRSGEKALDKNQIIMILASGAVGSLAYTFSDSFWFSATEGEVYALSSFFSAVVFWAILKWEQNFGKPRNNKWIILIAFMVGLSMGVHMLNLLAVPAIVFVYYFKTAKKITFLNFVLMGILSVAILGFLFGVFIPQVVNISGKIELFMVNGLGAPFNTGTILFFILLIGFIVWIVRFSAKKSLFAHTIALSFAFMLIGFSLFGILVIRSNANTPIDQNNPEDAVGLYSYLQREQYGSTPILTGHQYNSKVVGLEDGNPVYIRDDEKGAYVVKDDRKNTIKKYRSKDIVFFPRMHSSNSDAHIQNYMKWSGSKRDKIPTSGENMTYFWNYQFVHMYWRYFMWNFVGRQNDIQGHGGTENGNWISGIDFIDEMRLGSQDNIAEHQANNKGRNVYFFLPLILGLIGLFYQLKHDDKNTWVIFLLFLFTGLAIMVYVNQHAPQPRERDYAYVGSFYAFAMWIGLGVYGLWDMLKDKVKTPALGHVITVLSLVAVPGIMAAENWDDHDRSGRLTAVASGKNYLDSCGPNAILFTMGDNDTFPLWYLQEVEGYRTDVRVVNLSLFNTDWYINQLKREAYEGKPIPGKMTFEHFKQGTRDFAIYRDILKNKRIPISALNDFIISDDEQSKVPLRSGAKVDFFPTQKVSIPVNKENVKSTGLVPAKDYNKMVDQLDIDINITQLQKKDIAIIDMLSNFNWERPIHFAITISNSSRDFMFLDKYFELAGMTYKLTPIVHNKVGGQMGRIDTDALEKTLLTDSGENPSFHWGDCDKEDIYLDVFNRNMFMNYRNIYSRLAMELIREGKKDRAKVVLDKIAEKTFNANLPHNYFSIGIIQGYYLIGDKENARKHGMDVYNTFRQQLEHINSIPRTNPKRKFNDLELGRARQFSQYMEGMFRQYDPEFLAQN
ncbi:MAG: DUF2723 domain-containing protein [Flavobacteriales bacterium]|jgi:MFS family permease|nr:DUF2723 domain-containing protein [Flavobacteriales bacterium]